MRKILLAIIVFLVTVSSYSQVQLAWTKSYNHGTDFKDYANVTAVDLAGNIIVCGTNFDNVYENGSIITTIKYTKEGVELWRRSYGGDDINFSLTPVDIAIDAAGNIHILTQNATFNHVYTVLKYAANGTFRWLDRYAGIGEMTRGRMSDIEVDALGNVYVTGFSHSGVANGPTWDEESYYVTAKYDAEGERLWLKLFNGASPGTGQNKAYALVVDGSGNVYVTGGSQLDGQVDYATVKYGPNGTQLWVLRYSSPGNDFDRATDIGLDAFNNIYVTGETTVESGGLRNATIKYTSAGDLVWEKTSSAITGNYTGSVLKIDAGGNVIVARSEYAGSYNLGDLNYVITKFNGNGDVVWYNVYAGPDEHADILSSMELDHVNNVYVTGRSGNAIATARLNAANGALHWSQRFTPLSTGEDLPFIPVRSVIGIDIDLLGNVYVAGSYDPASSDPADFITLKYSQCNIVCPSNITVNADAGKCDAVVTFADVTTTGDCGAIVTYSHESGATFPIGTTTVTVTSDATGASCSFTITVVDNVNPVINYCPPSKSVNMGTGVCYATAASVNAGTATATDNCSATVEGTRSDGQPLTANYPAGITTITWKATDPSGNFVTCTQTITIVDNEPPVVSGETASSYVLSPPNHTMRDVSINYTISDNCSNVDTVITVTSNEPVNGTGDGDTDPDWIIVDKKNLKLRAERSANGNGRAYTITITATDGSGNKTSKILIVEVGHNIKKPNSGQAFIVGSTINFEGEFKDKPGKIHTGKWVIDESISVNGVVTETQGSQNGKVTGSYKFTTPGVYKLQMNTTDQLGILNYANTTADLESIVVIYDPNGGHAYGGGWYQSPAGALIGYTTATGKASYGFAVNYRNAAKPKGETQFEFKVGSFEFNALNFEYLAISNSMAQFKGTGKIIGGQSGVAFTMTVVDGQLDGTGIDKIRMKIYNKNNGKVIYDNQPGASDAALPTQAVGANSVIVIGAGIKQSATPANEVLIVRIESNLLTEQFEVGAFPNPHQGTFSLRVQSPKAGKMTIEYFTMTGAKIYMLEQQVKAYEQIVVPNTGLKFNGTIFYKVSIDGLIKTGKIIGIK